MAVFTLQFYFSSSFPVSCPFLNWPWLTIFRNYKKTLHANSEANSKTKHKPWFPPKRRRMHTGRHGRRSPPVGSATAGDRNPPGGEGWPFPPSPVWDWQGHFVSLSCRPIDTPLTKTLTVLLPPSQYRRLPHESLPDACFSPLAPHFEVAGYFLMHRHRVSMISHENRVYIIPPFENAKCSVSISCNQNTHITLLNRRRPTEQNIWRKKGIRKLWDKKHEKTKKNGQIHKTEGESQDEVQSICWGRMSLGSGWTGECFIPNKKLPLGVSL